MPNSDSWAATQDYQASGIGVVWTSQLGAAPTTITYTPVIDPSSALLDKSGNVLVAGSIANGIFSGSLSGEADTYLAKYTASGSLLWMRQFGTAGYDAAASIAVDDANNNYVAFESYDTVNSDWNISLVKYDANGNQIWSRLFGTAGDDRTPAVYLDADGSILVVYSAGQSLFSAVFDAAGNRIGNSQLSAPYAGVASPVRDSAGNVFFLYDVINGTDPQNQQVDTYLAKLTATKALAWSRKIDIVNSNGRPKLYSFNGTVYLTANEMDQITVEKYDAATGNMLWKRAVDNGYPLTRWVNSLAVDQAGYVYLAGTARDDYLNDTDAYLAKFDSAGTPVWSRRISTKDQSYAQHSDAAYALALDTNGSAFVTGTTIGSMGGPASGNGQELFLVKVDVSSVTNAAIQLPKTGQNLCWDGNGVPVPCVNAVGQDGVIRAGVEWPAQRFTNNGDQTVTDSLTGLQWAGNAGVPTVGSCSGSSYMSWEDSLAYVSCLNSANYLGHNDWRLPNFNELSSMINVSKTFASTWFAAQGFTNILGSYYWSSTSYAVDPRYAWVANVDYADINYTDKTNIYSVWPVRAGVPGTGTVSLPATAQTLCYDRDGIEIDCSGSGQDGELRKGVPTLVAGRFMNNGNQTGTDAFTGLTWATDGNMPTVGSCGGGADKIWTDALAYVACLNSANYLGYNDWRLPNLNELMSVHERGKSPASPWVNAGFSVDSSTYWTSTTYSGAPTLVWAVGAYDGKASPAFKDMPNGVWPVRGGLVPPPLATIAAPSEVQVLPPTVKKQLALNWVNPTDASFSHVHIYRSGNAGQLGFLLADNVAASGYIDVNLASRFTYWYTVRSVNNLGTESGNTAQVSGTTLDSAPPAMISGGTASNPNTDGKLNLSWNASPATDLAYYRIYRSTDGVTFGLVYDNLLNTTFVDTGLTNGQEYFYSLTAMDTSGNESAMTSAGEPQQQQQQGRAAYVIKATPTAYAAVPITSDHAGAVQLPHTGQTGCWNSQNAAIDCAGTGQDGDTRSGTPLPPLRFIDNGNGTITDSLTGLVWLKNASCFASQAWADALITANALASGSCGLTEGSAAGDWRLPNVNELESLVDLSGTVPAGMLNNAGFSGVQANYYWTSTTSPNPSYAMTVGMNTGAIDGSTGNYYKANKNLVWAVKVTPADNLQGITLPQTGQSTCYDTAGTVISCAGTGQDGDLRKGAAWPAARFNDNGNETQTDLLTGLTWSKDANAPGPNICGPAVTKNWQAGLDYIKCLNANSYLGYSDWRLPNRKEMLSLVNREQANSATWLNSQGFNNVTTGYYHTSTSRNSPWSVLLYYGVVYGTDKASSYRIWPVRGDITPPVITVTSGPLRYSNQVSGTIAFTANESATFQCSFDGSSYEACVSPFSYSTLANGLHTLAIKATDQAGNVSLLFNYTWTVNPALIASSALLLPQTGQTKCYDFAGIEIVCDGTRQDGDIQAGLAWPAPRFTDRQDGTVKDNLTGLIWTKDANSAVSSKTWQEAFDYIKLLNNSSYLGHNDWRIPNINELKSIFTSKQPSSDAWLGSQGFSNLQPNYYWSSTTLLSATNNAWICSLFNGDTNGGGKADSYFVWPVRDEQTGLLTIAKTGQVTCYGTDGTAVACRGTGQDGELQKGEAWPSPRFTITVDQTVADSLTGLIWSRDANPAGNLKTWQEALDFIKYLNTQNYLGYSDWRMPNVIELESLTNRSQSLNISWLSSSGIQNLQKSVYWMATSSANYTANARNYDLNLGGAHSSSKAESLSYVWPVRGGLAKTFQNLTVSMSGNGTGAVTSTPAGITCGVTCQANFATGQTVTLAAAPSAASEFSSWTGCDSVNGTACTVAMSGVKNVSAVFSNVAPPAAPNGIEVKTPAAKGELTLAWINPTDPDFNHVHVYRSTSPGQPGTLVGDNVTGVQYINTGLASQTTYFYTVRAVDTAGNESTNTDQVSGTSLDSTAPDAVTNVTVSDAASGGRLVISWTNPTAGDFDHVTIYRATSSSQPNYKAITNLTGTSYSDSGLTDGLRYYYMIRAFDTAGNFSDTAQYSGRPTYTDTTPPSYVSGGAAANPGTGGRLNLSWTAPSESDVAFYRIYRSNDGGISYTLVYNNVIGTAYSDTGLTNGARYYYSFTAVDTSGNESEQSSVHGLVWGKPTLLDVTPPAAIFCAGTITQPLPLTGDRLQLNWVKPADSDFAMTRVYASTGSGAGTLIYEGAGTAYLHTGLTAGTTYKYSYHSVDTAGNESPNNAVCDFTPVDRTAAACPTELKAVRNPNDSVTFSWVRSASSDIYAYQVFTGDGTAPLSYASPAATVNHPAVTWTSAPLSQGKIYQFGLRAVDSLLTNPNISAACGIINVAIPAPAPLCAVSAGIKVPQTGKKLGGNRTTVIAEIVSGSESDLASVLFQYRVSGPNNSWLNVPSTDNVTFPNPDTSRPWFVHWDITGLTDNTDYDIRAVATCTNAVQDAAPGYITTTVAKGQPDSSEEVIAGESAKTEAVGGSAASTVIKGDDSSKGVTTLTLPAGSTPEGTHVTVTETNPAAKAALVPTDYINGGCFREITFDDGRHALDNGKKAGLEMPYKDDDNNGIVDGTSIRVNDLQICDYDSSSGSWKCLDSTVDTTSKTVKAASDTFGLFGLLAPPKPLAAGWNLVSVPLTPVPADPASIFGTAAYTYDSATGLKQAVSTVEPGRAYWVQDGFSAIKVTGTETVDAGFSIPLQNGWNLIGNPFRYKVRVRDLKVVNGATAAMATAEKNGWVIGTLFNYTNGSYQMSTFQDDGTMSPWKGYWLLSDINGTLIVPNTPAQ